MLCAIYYEKIVKLQIKPRHRESGNNVTDKLLSDVPEG